MNTWRNKGYVPDSDDDEDFESQESRIGYIDQQGHALDDGDKDGLQLTGSEENKNQVENGKGAEEREQYSQSVELESNDGGYNDDEDDGAHGHSQDLLSVDSKVNNESDTVIPNETRSISAESASAKEALPKEDEVASSDDDLQVIDVVPNYSTAIHTMNSGDTSHDVLISDNDSDSPLSSAPSIIVSPDSSQQFHQIHGVQNHQPQRFVGPQMENLTEDDAISQTLTSTILPLDTGPQPQRRSLRERKEIQVHPYLIEDAKYQSLFRKAGLKPVRVPTAGSTAARPEEESQESMIGAPEPPSSPASEFIFPPSSPPDPYKSPASIRRHQTPTEKSDSRHGHSQPHSQKRRKLFHDNQVKKHKQQTSFSVVIEKTDNSVSSMTTQLVQALPSPPRSGSVSSAAHLGRDGFRFPRGFTPPPPKKTSDTNIQSVMGTDDLTFGDEFQSDTPRDADDDHIASQTSGEDSEPEETVPEIPDRAVKQYQRRIKGVLPASWLTLDLKNKGEKTGNTSLDRHQREVITTRAERQKGVARPISRPRNTALDSPTRRATFTFLGNLSDSDDAELGAPAAVGSPAMRDSHKSSVRSRDFYDLTNDIDGEIPEDNRLEEVSSPLRRSLSSHSRSHSSAPRTYKRKQVSYKNNQPDKSRPLRQMRLDDGTPRPPKRKVRKPRIPNLSILDAPDVALRSREEQPQFLRVATRQARSRKDQGRSSPSRKVFNMATREETKETNKALWDWKKGSMKQAKLSITSTPRSIRQPLQDLSTNRPQRMNRNHTSTQPQSSVTEERPRFLEELDLTSENITLGQPTAVSPPKSRVTSTTRKQSSVVRRNVINRKHAITSLRRDTARPVESEIVGGEASLSPYAFSASLAALRRERERKFTLDRYISALDSSYWKQGQSSQSVNQTTSENQENPQPARKKPPRKRAPVRAEVVDIDPMPQITASLEPSRLLKTNTTGAITNASNTLYGFRNYRVFSVDFNMLPIRKGTFFHDSTFIGEGGLARSLNINKRNMDQDAGFTAIDLGDQVFRWGSWTEDVSSEIGAIFNLIKNDLMNYDPLPAASPNSDTFRIFVFMIRWITDNLHFIDPIDRVSFIDRVEFLICDLQNHIATASHTNHSGWKDHLRFASLNMVLVNQIRQVASHELVNVSKRESSLELVKRVSRQLLCLVYTKHGLQNIRQLYEKSEVTEFHEAGIRHDYPAVEAYVVVFRILHSSPELQGWFNELALTLFADRVTSSDVQHLEEVWESVFTTLPLNEIDESGLGRPGLRFREKYDHWPIVQALLSKVFDTYYFDSDQPTFYINYCRILFQRCLLLMVSWSWRHCRGILGALFDFYAKNMMYNLKTEQSFGSPSFLEALDTNPTIEVEPGDSSFHLFLKTLGSGLRYLAQVHDKKTMRNIAWRFLPNHGRVYPKEKPLAHEDLDALRNHHDLLCTLYWAVPDICRPRLQTIRNLIDPATSHLETTSLSIRSWRRLVHFKLSTNEEDGELKPFADWYRSFAMEIVRQHQLAKIEVEMQAKNQIQFSKQDIESTVSHNQRQVEALISSTIAAMDSAIQSSRSFSQACLLVEGFPIAKLFELFDPVNSRVNPIICDALQLVIIFLKKDPLRVDTMDPTANDDSQEYGDWSALEEVFDDGVNQPAAPSAAFPYLQEVIRPCVYHLLSNCFGQDRSPEDSLLLKVTECWSALAHASVRNGLEHWDSYLNPYSAHSWTALRMTPQTKKFVPQFLANCIENDHQFFSECRLQILSMWISSLVERTSALKFQHRLTEVLLNEDQTSLMKNLPFSRGADGQYHISMSELRERRISLISSLLSNMREHLQTQDNSPSANTKIVDEYRELVTAMMAAMRTNYQELSQSGKAVQGQYVEFVHSIISFMQQHTQSICPLDRYFTDPGTFPLPPGDPGLVVAKLKGYGVRLPAAKAAKELVNFLQGICESAALDDRQNDLVDQLCESMRDTYESGDTASPTLRSFLFHCLFPAYIECARSNAAAWILVLPIMKSISRATNESLYDIDINDRGCVESVNSMFGTILRAIKHTMHVFLQHADYTEETRAPLILKSCIEIISTMVPILDYINRNDLLENHNIAILKTLRRYVAFIVDGLFEPSTVLEDKNEISPEDPADNTYLNSLFLEYRTYTIRQVQTYLRANWSKHGDRYFVRRGRESKEIIGAILKSKEVIDIDYAKSSLVEAANMFLHRWESFEQPDVQAHSDNFRGPNIYDTLGGGFDDLLL